jgi:hypothetical protein
MRSHAVSTRDMRSAAAVATVIGLFLGWTADRGDEARGVAR